MADRPRAVGIALLSALAASQAALVVANPLLPEVGRDLGVSIPAAGQLRTVSGFAAGSAALVTGLLAARSGLRELLLGGIALLACGSLVSAISPGFAVSSSRRPSRALGSGAPTRLRSRRKQSGRVPRSARGSLQSPFSGRRSRGSSACLSLASSAAILRKNLARIDVDLRARALPNPWGEITKRDSPGDAILTDWFVDYADPSNFVNATYDSASGSATGSSLRQKLSTPVQY